jgi:hypothetical protein
LLSDVLIVLDKIVVCDKDLKDIAINLAIAVGQFSNSTDWS